ncbi:hypothetical protein BU17DRAFT_40268 [Hysterangium stoloniferum]|nr:hypothetical protein BU17DRAFT_40268 [Hysterangium stoloniferum]
MDIIQITFPETYPVRRAVLYPNGPEHKILIPNDEEGIHFGASTGSEDDEAVKGGKRELIGVVSLFREPLPPSPHVDPARSLRFRKFACLESYQGRGIGTKMLQHIIDFARDDSALGPGSVIWCDARVSVKGWYLKRGFRVLGTPFFKGDIEYVAMALDV